jgi:hypothetical protein
MSLFNTIIPTLNRPAGAPQRRRRRRNPDRAARL